VTPGRGRPQLALPRALRPQADWPSEHSKSLAVSGPLSCQCTGRGPPRRAARAGTPPRARGPLRPRPGFRRRPQRRRRASSFKFRAAAMSLSAKERFARRPDHPGCRPGPDGPRVLAPWPGLASLLPRGPRRPVTVRGTLSRCYTLTESPSSSTPMAGVTVRPTERRRQSRRPGSAQGLRRVHHDFRLNHKCERRCAAIAVTVTVTIAVTVTVTINSVTPHRAGNARRGDSGCQ
jgi:hypothetical protein